MHRKPTNYKEKRVRKPAATAQETAQLQRETGTETSGDCIGNRTTTKRNEYRNLQRLHRKPSNYKEKRIQKPAATASETEQLQRETGTEINGDYIGNLATTKRNG